MTDLVGTIHQTYQALCREARQLTADPRFLAYVQRPGMLLNDVLRFVLDAYPRLELLPLDVLGEEVAGLLSTTPGQWGRGPTRV